MGRVMGGDVVPGIPYVLIVFDPDPFRGRGAPGVGPGPRTDRRRASGLRQDRLAADAAADHGLHPQLPRSHERELRGAHDERGHRPDGHAVRARLGAVLLPRLLLPRSAEQRRALPVRSAPLAVAHHDQLGAGLGGDVAGHRSQQLLPAAAAARRRRSRLLPRRRLLPGHLVSRRVPDADHRLVHGGDPDLGGDRRSGLRVPPRARWRARPRGLAMAVHRRRPARGRSSVSFCSRSCRTGPRTPRG